MPAGPEPSPPPYLGRVVAHLRQHERRLWEHFAEALAAPSDDGPLRLELLKSSVRLDRATHGRIYAMADAVAAALALPIPITFYQAIGPQPAINARVMSHASEAHVVLQGPAVQALCDPELTSLVAHELAHLQLWRREEGAYCVADAVLQHMAAAPGAHPAHPRTYSLYRQYCEVFADRASLAVTGDLQAVISCLVKVETGLVDVSAQAYLQQAEELLRSGATPEGLTHPETFIRARALARWAQAREGSEDELRRNLEGPVSLDSLDLLRQAEWEALTRGLLDAVLAEAWMRTDATLAHARLFFSDYAPGTPRPEALVAALAEADASARDYACFCLLDFTAVDPELSDAALAQAFSVAEPLGLSPRLGELVSRELGWTRKRIQAVRSGADGLRQQAASA